MDDIVAGFTEKFNAIIKCHLDQVKKNTPTPSDFTKAEIEYNKIVYATKALKKQK